MCVDDQYRRHGVAAMLLRELVTTLRLQSSSCCPKPMRLTLHVQATNKVARCFYRKEGFKSESFKKDYYLHNQLKPLDPDLTKSPAEADGLEEEETEAEDSDAWFLVLDL